MAVKEQFPNQTRGVCLPGARLRGGALSIALHAVALWWLWGAPPAEPGTDDAILLVQLVPGTVSPEAAPAAPQPPEPKVVAKLRPHHAPSNPLAPGGAGSRSFAAGDVVSVSLPADNGTLAPAGGENGGANPRDVSTPTSVAGQGDTDAMADYSREVWTRIMRNRPLGARSFLGRSIVSFAIGRDGNLLSAFISNPVAVPVMMRLRWRPSPAARRSLHRRRPTTMAACDFPYPSISIRPAIVVGHRLSYTQSHNCIFSLDRIPRIPNIAAVLVSPWAVFKGIKREHGEASTPLGPQPGLPPQLSAASPRS